MTNDTEKLIEKFNTFIFQWCGSYYAHLIDNDDNAGEKMRTGIKNAIDLAYQAGVADEREKVRGKIRSETLSDDVKKDTMTCPLYVMKERMEYNKILLLGFNDFKRRILKDLSNPTN